jgi:hypothetical protein
MSGEVKMLSPNTTLWWADINALTTPASPKITEVTAGLASSVVGSRVRNISLAICAGYTLNAQDSDTTTSPTIADLAVAETRGAANYEALLPAYREATPLTNTLSDFLAFYNLFKVKGLEGYIYRRVGKLNTSALVATDVVDVFKALSLQPRSDDPDNNSGAYRFIVPFAKRGFMLTNVTCQA